MGIANKRGTLEMRIAHAKAAKQKAFRDAQTKREEVERQRWEARRLQNKQEQQAYEIMVWWQIELSELRDERIQARRLKREMDDASMFMMLASAFSFAYQRR